MAILRKEKKTMRKKEKVKFVVSWIMYIVGFIMWCVFLNMNNNISTEAWLNTIGAGFGVLLFCLSGTVRDN